MNARKSEPIRATPRQRLGVVIVGVVMIIFALRAGK
jgi:hypothetical protein